MGDWILTLVIFSPLPGVAALLMLPRAAAGQVRTTALACSLLTLVLIVIVVTVGAVFYGVDVPTSTMPAARMASSA